MLTRVRVDACVHACVTLLCNVLRVCVCVQARAVEAAKAQEIAALEEELAAANSKLCALREHAQHTTALSTLAFNARAKAEAQWRQWQVRAAARCSVVQFTACLSVRAASTPPRVCPFVPRR